MLRTAPEPHATQPADTQAIGVTVSGSEVLLVEDNHINQQLAMNMLQSHGYAVKVAENVKIEFEKASITTVIKKDAGGGDKPAAADDKPETESK